MTSQTVEKPEKEVTVLKGGAWISAPGFIRSQAHDFQFEGETRWKAITIVSNTWGLPVFRVEQLLGDKCVTEEDGNDLKVIWPD